jgi:hypothetical protein
VSEPVDFAKQLEENETWLRAKKVDVEMRRRAGEEIDLSDLERIAKLEIKLQNLRLYVEARELTRD